MTEAFDVARARLGEAAGPDLVAAIERLPLDEVDDLAESMLDLPRSAALASRPVTEIWPLIPLRASLFFDQLNHGSPTEGYAQSGIQLSAAANPRLSGTGVFSAGIIRALLYSHGLVIEDPLRHAAEMHLTQDQELRKVTRLGIAAAVASLSEIADLLDSGVVNVFYTGGDELAAAGELGDDMVTALDAEGTGYSIDDAWDEFEIEFISGLPTSLQELWKQIRSGNRSPDLGHVRRAVDEGGSDLAETFVDIVQVLSPRAIVQNAIASTACTVAAIHRLGGSSDVLCASPLMARLLFLGTADPAQQLRVQELARTTVPNIDGLSPRDLVDIRRSSTALAGWREDLATALDYADRVRKVGTDSLVVQAGVEEMLADARARLRAEARRTRVWSGSSLVSFVAGGLGGAGGAVVGDSVASVVAGAGAGVLGAFLQATGQRRGVPGFLDRHYLAFTRPQR